MTQDFQWNEQPKRKRKRIKRYAGSDDDDFTRKKSRKVVASDPETDNEYLDVVDAVDSGHEFEDDNENDYFPSDSKLTTKGQKGKGKASVTKGAAKRKAKVDNTSEVATTSKKRPKPAPKSSKVSIDVVGDGSSTPDVTVVGDRSIHTISKPDSPPSSMPQQPPPRKQKLPTIKKVKLPNLNVPTSTTAKDTTVLPLASKPVPDGVRKTLAGTIDIDLSNKSIYEEIFSKTVCVFVFLLMFFVHVSVGARRWVDTTSWRQPTDQGGRKTERAEPTKG